MNVRRARAADLEAVLAVHRAAFGRDEEAEIAAAIVESGQFPPELSLAAVVDERIAGHVISSWVGLEGSERRLLQLGPIGVLPELQGHGIGSALVRASLEATSALGEPLLLLEGSRPTTAASVSSVPTSSGCSRRRRHDWAFQVAVLDERAGLPRGRVVYPPTFVH